MKHVVTPLTTSAITNVYLLNRSRLFGAPSCRKHNIIIQLDFDSLGVLTHFETFRFLAMPVEMEADATVHTGVIQLFSNVNETNLGHSRLFSSEISVCLDVCILLFKT